MFAIRNVAVIAAVVVAVVWKAATAFLRSRRLNAPILKIVASKDTNGLDDKGLYIKDMRKLLDVGWERYGKHERNYFIDTPIGRQLVIASRHLEELQRSPDSLANNIDANEEIMQFRHTLDIKLMYDHFHVDQPIKKLTSSLGPRLPDIVDEGLLALEDHLGSPKDWVSLKIMPLSFKIVTRTANRLLFGIDLCRNDDFLQLSIDYTAIMFGGANSIRNYPEFLKPLILWWKSGVHQAQAQARKHLVPVIEERIRRMRAYEVQGRPEEWTKVKPEDTVQWVIDAAPRNQLDPKELVLRMLHINIAAVHTSTISFTDSMMCLALLPDLQKELRDEIEAVLVKDGEWTKQGLTHLQKLDSFMKETARFCINGALKVKRVARKDFHLSDGTFVPRGTTIGVDQYHHDKRDDIFPRASEFDPLRSYHKRQEPGQENMHQFVMASETNLTFGLGRHACPGRFFASNEIKTLLVLVLMRYEFRMQLPGGLQEVFDGVWHNETRSPIRYGVTEFKSRYELIPNSIKALF